MSEIKNIDDELAEKLDELYSTVIDILAEIMQDKTATSTVRMQAAQVLLKAREEANKRNFFDNLKL